MTDCPHKPPAMLESCAYCHDALRARAEAAEAIVKALPPDLALENIRLMAENIRLRADMGLDMSGYSNALVERDELRAEVARLRAVADAARQIQFGTNFAPLIEALERATWDPVGGRPVNPDPMSVDLGDGPSVGRPGERTMKKQLYNVRVEFEVIVYAVDEDSAEDIAHSAVVNGECGDADTVMAGPLQWPPSKELLNSIPFGDQGESPDEPAYGPTGEELTVEQLIKAGAAPEYRGKKP